MKRLLILCIIFSAALTYTSTTASALTTTNSLTDRGINVNVLPELPEAGVPVTITLQSFSTDLSRASVIWKENGTVVSSGTGNTTFQTTSPGVGNTKTIIASIVTTTGLSAEKIVTIVPQDIDLLIESLDGYTPPFYKGRSLPVREGLVKVSAIPHVSGITDNKDAIYSWTHNESTSTSFSGYGKRYFVYKNAFLDQSDTIVSIVSPQIGSSAGRREKTINFYQPKVLLYEDHPSRGLLTNRALGDGYTMTEPESTFVAIPYFYSTSIYNNPLSPNLNYLWSINGSQTTPTERNRITLRRPEGSGGTASLEVEVDNTASSFQPDTKTKTSVSF